MNQENSGKSSCNVFSVILLFIVQSNVSAFSSILQQINKMAEYQGEALLLKKALNLF